MANVYVCFHSQCSVHLFSTTSSITIGSILRSTTYLTLMWRYRSVAGLQVAADESSLRLPVHWQCWAFDNLYYYDVASLIWCHFYIYTHSPFRSPPSCLQCAMWSLLFKTGSQTWTCTGRPPASGKKDMCAQNKSRGYDWVRLEWSFRNGCRNVEHVLLFSAKDIITQSPTVGKAVHVGNELASSTF